MEKVELVFMPSTLMGHLGSSIEFAKRLTELDSCVWVTILVMNPLLPTPKNAYTDLKLVSSDSRIRFVDLPEVDLPSLDLLKSPEKYTCTHIENHKPHVKHALSQLMSNSATGLVLDFFCLSMIDVANELGISSYLFFTSGALFLGAMLYLVTHDESTGTVFELSGPELKIPSFMNPVPSRVLPEPMLNRDGGYATFAELGKRFDELKGIVVNSFSDLEPFAIRSVSDGRIPLIYPIGPILKLNSGSDPVEKDRIMSWLGEQPPSSVVFLCFGSMGSLPASQVREIANGLEQSGFRFLWSVPKIKLKDDDDDRVNYEEILPGGFLDLIGQRGLVCEWVPQVEVLAHPAVGVFVSHCGWNSILESVWFGVPIVAWPLYAEQQLNAFGLVRELGLAVEMRVDYRCGDEAVIVKAEKIDEVIRRAMENDGGVRERMKEMREKSRKAVMNGGSSFNSCGNLIRDMIKNSYSQ